MLNLFQCSGQLACCSISLAEQQVAPSGIRMLLPVQFSPQIECLPVFRSAQWVVTVELCLPSLQRSDRCTVVVVEAVRSPRLLHRGLQVFGAFGHLFLAKRDRCKIVRRPHYASMVIDLLE